MSEAARGAEPVPGPGPGQAPEDPPEHAPRGAESGRGLKSLTAADFSLADAIGGARGMVESIAPGLVFVVVYLVTSELTPALIAASAVTVVAVVARLAQRTPVTQALSGAIGVGIGVFWAARSGQPEDYFVVGLLTNGGYLAACLISMVTGWPLVGLVVGMLRGEGTTWRADARARRVYQFATGLWAAMFGLRLAVQVPLYLGAELGWLGTARLVMGVPLWALILWLTWLLVRTRAAPQAPARSPLDP